MLRIARYTVPAAAAAVLVAFIIGSFFTDGGEGSAFADVLENVKKVRSVRFFMTGKLGRGPAMSSRYSVRGNVIRMEMMGMMVMIADMDKKEAVQLNLAGKTANRWKLDDRMARQFGKVFANPLEHFRNLKGADAEKVGQRIVAKRKVDVYVLKKFDLMGIRVDATKSNDAQLTVLVDQETGLPVRIMLEASSHVEGKSDDWYIFDGFDWEPKLDPKHFSLEVPKGFQTIEGPVGPGPRSRPAPKPGSRP